MLNNTLLAKMALPEKSAERKGFRLRSILSKPLYQFILFGIIICIIGILATNQILLPYSWASALASTFVYAIAAIGFCLLMGYSGLASLGTGGFIAIGTYAAHFIMGAGVPFIVAMLVAVALAVILGMAVGFISLRIEGIYLCILTLGLSEILRNLMIVVKDTAFLNKISLFGLVLPKRDAIYVVTALLVVVMIITSNIINSPTGRAMLAMKNSTAAAQSMGISLMKYRLLAFVICTVYAALAGLMYMIVVRSAMASSASGLYSLMTSLNILAAVIIGGARSIWGSLFGTFIMYGLQTMFLNNIPFFQKNPVIITFISGVLVIVVVMFYPGGLAQLVTELKLKITKLVKKIKEAKYGKDI